MERTEKINMYCENQWTCLNVKDKTAKPITCIIYHGIIDEDFMTKHYTCENGPCTLTDRLNILGNPLKNK